MPQCKPTQKHVMFWWQLSASFDRLKITRHKTWTAKLEPQYLPPTETYQVLMGSPTHVSMPKQPKSPKHIPIKTCNILGAMFWPYVPIFHVPPCNPHPCPMTHPWRFRPFSTSHHCRVFFCQILTSSSSLPYHRFT